MERSLEERMPVWMLSLISIAEALVLLAVAATLVAAGGYQ